MWKVKFADGEVQEFEGVDELKEAVKDVAGCGVLPETITNPEGKNYYCEWMVDIVPCLE